MTADRTELRQIESRWNMPIQVNGKEVGIFELANEMLREGFVGQTMYDRDKSEAYILMAAEDQNVEAKLPPAGFNFWKIAAFQYWVWRRRKLRETTAHAPPLPANVVPASEESRRYVCMRVAEGARAIDIIPDRATLSKLHQRCERGVTFKWTFDKDGKPLEIGLTEAKDGESALELRHYPVGSGYRVACPEGMTVEDAKAFVTQEELRSVDADALHDHERRRLS
jgi:hypothetical protein